MEILVVQIRDRAEVEIPLIGVVGLEVEVRVLVLVGLLHDSVLEVVAFAQGAVAVVVVIHPLIDRRRLLTYSFQSRMRMQQGEGRRQAVIRDAPHTHFAIVVGNILDQPIDRIVGVGRFVCGFRIAQVNP